MERSATSLAADERDRRSRAVRWMAWFVFPWSIGIGMGMWLLEEPGAAVAVGLVAPGSLGSVALARRGFVQAAGHLLVLSLMQALWIISVLLGGVSSPPTQWWVLAPVMATAAGGIRAGMAWTAIMVAGAGALHAVQAMGYVDVPYLFVPGWDWMGTGTTMGLLILMVGYLWANDVQYRRLLERVSAAESAEREANRAKSAFLANMSHELRTPLNAIRGYSELVAEEASDRDLPEMVDDLHRVQRAGRHLLGLVDDVLDLSKIEAGRLELILADVQVADVVHAVAEQVRPAIEANGNELVVQVEPHTVWADRVRLKQCLLNVMSNAAKFTENGRIELRAAEGCFEVRDTGIGMTPLQQDRVFEPFAQAEAHTQRRFGGTGLGLAIVARLVEQMEGEVRLQSQVGQGTCVWLQVPMHRRG